MRHQEDSIKFQWHSRIYGLWLAVIWPESVANISMHHQDAATVVLWHSVETVVCVWRTYWLKYRKQLKHFWNTSERKVQWPYRSVNALLVVEEWVQAENLPLCLHTSTGTTATTEWTLFWLVQAFAPNAKRTRTCFRDKTADSLSHWMVLWSLLNVFFFSSWHIDFLFPLAINNQAIRGYTRGRMIVKVIIFHLFIYHCYASCPWRGHLTVSINFLIGFYCK